MKPSVEAIIDLYEFRGHLKYDGEAVTQIEHAWQCGRLAKESGASACLQLAAWLHDVGHLLSKLEGKTKNQKSSKSIGFFGVSSLN